MVKTKSEWMERFFLDHGAALQAFFRRRIRVSLDAPDLAQEVYVRMLRLKDSDAIRNPEVYLYAVANNLVKEHALTERRAAANHNIDDQELQEQLAELPDLDEDIDSEAKTRRVHDALEELSPKCRAVMVLQYREGCSYQEIAEQLGISTHMVKKYIVQALGHFRRRMAGLR